MEATLTASQRELVELHANLPEFVARLVAKNGDVEEAESVATQGLLRAAMRYDSSRGEFKPFAIVVMKGEIFRALSKRRERVSLDAIVSEDGEGTPLADLVAIDRRSLSPIDQADNNEQKDRLVKTLKRSKSITLKECRERTPVPVRLGEYYEQMREAVCDSVSAEDVGEIMQALLAKAKAGDVAAAKLVLHQVAGPAAPRVIQCIEAKTVTLSDLDEESE
jgi:DNA-directed RNA polymerase specialized sigma24 family protein